MKLVLESTDEIINVDGAPARVWKGETGQGVPCFALIAAVGVQKDEDASQFQAELKERFPLGGHRDRRLQFEKEIKDNH